MDTSFVWAKQIPPILSTVFPRIVSAKLFFFGSWSAETIQGRKLFKGGNYCFLAVLIVFMTWILSAPTFDFALSKHKKVSR